MKGIVLLASKLQTPAAGDQPRVPSRTDPNASMKQKGKWKEQHALSSSWQVFVQGASIYSLCLIVPKVLAVMSKWEYTRSICNRGLYYFARLICAMPFSYAEKWCLRALELGGDSTKASTLTSAFAPDTGISDVAIVAFLSIFLSLLRLALVHVLVPGYKQPKRLAALVRCKSIHMLSSSYSGTVTPQSSVHKRHVDLADIQTKGLSLVNLAMEEEKPAQESVGQEPQSLFSPDVMQQPEGEEDEDFEFADLTGSLGLVLDEQQEKIPVEDMDTSPAVTSGLLTSSSALSLQALLHQASPMTTSNRQDDATGDDHERMFAAPKYATACFKLIFCTASCGIALVYFTDADFWPPAVGGVGNTKNCWDLSSVGATVMDPDFDKHKTVLRRYYLVQLSYHLHSVAFHILVASLLWFVSSRTNEKQRTPGFIPSGMWSIHNFHSLFRHGFAVGLMTFTYLFSSLRRLGVIAMFAFDLSSWFMHLLQMCINARTGSRRVSPLLIRLLHGGLVMPAFCYSRFYVFPFVVAYSALEESQDWLRQLENMLIPGTARSIHGVFVVSFLLFMILNFVHARRLMYHSHVEESLVAPAIP